MSVVIIGSGHGGATAAIELRRAGYREPITIVGDEYVIPYHRPPLSKGWLKGEASHESLALRSAEWYVDNNVALLLNNRAARIDRESHTVVLADDSVLHFSHLIIATGARARRLTVPGADLPGVLTLRNIKDADLLKKSMGPRTYIAIIGGGYVGLETAASGRSLGAEVFIIERESRVLARVACPILSEFFTAVHRSHGVSFELGADLVRFIGHDRVEGVELAGGRVIACDTAIVGVGAIPNDELARSCGLPCADGIVVDEHSRTSDLAVFAVGDVTRRPLSRYERQGRLESVPNAIEQAKQAAAAICVLPSPAAELPWFWSDQYDVKLQIAGLAFDCDDIVTRGDPASNSFSLFHLKGSQVEAVEAVNAPGDFMFGKVLINRRIPIERKKLADLATPIRESAMTI
jgi:3-phenylpropionate/trans-cinnamate dioxygenase ferredoxin reductase component